MTRAGIGVLLVLSLIATAYGVGTVPRDGAPKKTEVKGQPAKAMETPVTASIQTKSDEATLGPRVPEAVTTKDAADFDIPWRSVNTGGGPSNSANFQFNGSVGQATIGHVSSTSYEAGVGYWYGFGLCRCPFQCDYDEDGFLTALDLSAFIDVLFAGEPEVQDPDCIASRGDFNNDGFPDALDLSGVIDHLFAGGDPPCDPCNPVQSTCAK